MFVKYILSHCIHTRTPLVLCTPYNHVYSLCRMCWIEQTKFDLEHLILLMVILNMHIFKRRIHCMYPAFKWAALFVKCELDWWNRQTYSQGRPIAGCQQWLPGWSRYTLMNGTSVYVLGERPCQMFSWLGDAFRHFQTQGCLNSERSDAVCAAHRLLPLEITRFVSLLEAVYSK